MKGALVERIAAAIRCQDSTEDEFEIIVVVSTHL